MKIYSIKVVQLVLFLVVFAPCMVVGMEPSVAEAMAGGPENIEELLQNSQERNLLAAIPVEVKTLILTKVLRLVLDEVEDNPQQLMSRKKVNHVYAFAASFFTSKDIKEHESVNNIDYIIKLTRAKDIGADSNTKSYKGNNVLHQAISGVFLQTAYYGEMDSELQLLQDKIALLAKYKLDLNAKNGTGNTIAHELIAAYANQYFEYRGKFIEFLHDLGMTVSIVTNNDGCTAYDMMGLMLKDSSVMSEDFVFAAQLSCFLAQEQFRVAMKQMTSLTQRISDTTDKLNTQLSEK